MGLCDLCESEPASGAMWGTRIGEGCWEQICQIAVQFRITVGEATRHAIAQKGA